MIETESIAESVTQTQLQAELTKLNIKRGAIKRKLGYTKTFLNNFQNNDVGQVQNRINNLSSMYEEFFECQYRIEHLESLLGKTSTEGQAEQFAVEYNETLSGLQSLIEIPASAEQANLQTPERQLVTNSSELSVRLPTINLPSFDGSYSEWTSFSDTFEALIDKNDRIPDIQKFHYLKSCLKNEANRIIESLTVSAANYKSAWETLQKRYNNKRLIVQEHLYAILNAPTINKNSQSTLRQLSDTFIINLNALKALNIDTRSWDPILTLILTEKLDFATKKEWQAKLTAELPKWSDLTAFIEQRCQTIESLAVNNKFSMANNTNKSGVSRSNGENNKGYTRFAALTLDEKTSACVMCRENHSLFKCTNFLSLSIHDRINFAKSHKLCNNCLKSNHSTRDCKASNCRVCQKRHNTLLHLHSNSNTQENQNRNNSTERITAEPAVANSCVTTASANTISKSSFTNVLLPTALVIVSDANGKKQTFRALLDSGSQLNFITESTVNKLGLPVTKKELAVIGINQTVKQMNKSASCMIQSNYTEYRKNLTGVIVEKISENLPQCTLDASRWQIPDGVDLADPTFAENRPIDILIGADTFWELVMPGKSYSKPHGTIIQETKLGWIISGVCPNNKRAHFNCNTVSILQKQIEKFWEIESFDNKIPLSEEDHLCEENFETTFERTFAGNFSVKLPFKNKYAGGAGLHSNYTTALTRYKALETKFKKDPKYKQDYVNVMEDYLRSGHIEKVSAKNIQNSFRCFYLPHHGVIKPDSLTTKLRIVFDASCKSHNQLSLNDMLSVGPKLQEDLFHILLRFRKHAIAFSADIEKMYFQVEVHPEHRDFQRLFWRARDDGPVETYRIKKVTFGIASAPYLAIKSMQKLATLESTNFPLASPVIMQDFYMDDLLTGAETVEEALELKSQLSNCLSKGGFRLRKWSSNDAQVIQNSQQHDITLNSDSSKILGMFWNGNSDNLFYSTNSNSGSPSTHENSEKYTKRRVLAVIARLYDPLGLINPLLVTAKVVLQKLWTLQLGWDDPIPSDLEITWRQFTEDLRNIDKISIPRQVIGIHLPEALEIHAFSDASQAAYGTCIYIRAVKGKQISMRLLCAKSRIAPIKSVALPRLELCAATLLARLLHSVKQSMKINFSKTVCWTDSTIVLSWINSVPNTLETFVGNRVAEIQDKTNMTDWRHIPTKLNPADVLSRGCRSAEIQHNSLWNSGPNFLQQADWVWPPNIMNKAVSLTSQGSDHNGNVPLIKRWQILDKFSDFGKLVRIIAWCKRFTNKCRKDKSSGPLTIKELDQATSIIIKQVQAQHFSKEVKKLSENKQCPPESKMLALHPFIDEDLILRVGGRLANSTLPYNRKFPVVLPKNDYITKLIIKQIHSRELHAGPQATLAAIRQKYWPLCGRSTVRQEIHKCVKCAKVKPIKISELMGNLPAYRITQSTRPFINTGIDYAGPILTKQSRGRGTKSVKSYISLFICLVTKAIHLELVSDCTSESFINALKRFMARRGKPSIIVSDNATTFKGADREIQNCIKAAKVRSFIDDLSQDKIEFKFIPPRSPHFGGIYEAGIKSVKYHLKRIVGQSLLTYEEMYTVLTLIEACLNSRPITPLPESPSELEALTPGHFLIGSSLTATPEPDRCETKENRLSRWQRVEQIRQHFWKRWSQEYLTELQHRTKWKTTNQQHLSVGTTDSEINWYRNKIITFVGQIAKQHKSKTDVILI
jgi:hypothetical protein